MHWRSIIAGCAVVMVAAGARAQQPAVAVVNVSVIPMDSERVLAGQTVLIQGDRIAAIGPASQVAVPKGAVQVDGQGKFLLPGLADMHVHFYEPRWNAPDEMPEILLGFLQHGLTTVRLMHSGSPRGEWRGYGSDSLAIQLKAALAAGQLVGPHLYTAGDMAADQEAATIRADVVTLKAHGHDFVKMDEQWNDDVYDLVRAVADSVGLRVAGHVPQSWGAHAIEQVLAARWASVEHLMGYVNYVLGFDEGVEAGGSADEAAAWVQPSYQLDQGKLRAIAAATQRAGVWNCPTLNAVEHGDGPSGRIWVRYFSFDLQVVKALQEAGAGLLFGTDMHRGADLFPDAGNGPAVYAGQSQRELALLRQAGLTPYQVLATATRNVARFMGTDGGTVAVGQRADLVLLPGNPLTDLQYTAAPAGVVLGGRWLSSADLAQRVQAARAERSRVAEQRPRDEETRGRAQAVEEQRP